MTQPAWSTQQQSRVTGIGTMHTVTCLGASVGTHIGNSYLPEDGTGGNQSSPREVPMLRVARRERHVLIV